MGSMQDVVAKPQSFVTLDNFLNSTNDHVDIIAKLTDSTTHNIGFGPLGIYPATGALLDHWKNDWIGKPGTFGGAYWPYLFNIDVATILRNGFLNSIGLLASGAKKHNTIWICAGKPSEEWLKVSETDYKTKAQSVAPMTVAEQESWFEVAVQEGKHVVNLMICTPMPLKEFKARNPEKSISVLSLTTSSASLDDPDEFKFPGRRPPANA